MKKAHYGKPISSYSKVRTDNSFGQTRSSGNLAMYQIAKAFPNVTVPTRQCPACHKVLPFFTKKGRRHKSKYCDKSCAHRYYKEIHRTKPKVNRGKKRPGL